MRAPRHARVDKEVRAACDGLETSFRNARANGRLTPVDASSLCGRFFDDGGHISSNVKQLYKQELCNIWDKIYA